MSDLTERLRALSRFEHGDVSIGSEAADMIEGLREVANEAELNREGIKHAHAALREARERLARVSAIAVDLANDVETDAEERYRLRSQYPHMQLHFDRDMASVRELRAILDGEA